MKVFKYLGSFDYLVYWEKNAVETNYNQTPVCNTVLFQTILLPACFLFYLMDISKAILLNCVLIPHLDRDKRLGCLNTVSQGNLVNIRGFFLNSRKLNYVYGYLQRQQQVTSHLIMASFPPGFLSWKQQQTVLYSLTHKFQNSMPSHHVLTPIYCFFQYQRASYKRGNSMDYSTLQLV